VVYFTSIKGSLFIASVLIYVIVYPVAAYS